MGPLAELLEVMYGHFLPPVADASAESFEAAGLAFAGAGSDFAGADSFSFAESAFASFFGDEYRSLYQPPPRSTKELRLTILLSCPFAPQPLHRSGGGSFTFCRTSLSFPHFSQTYSYIGMIGVAELVR